MQLGERLITAADFSAVKHGGIAGVHRAVLGLADSVRGTGLTIKKNSALRAVGYSLITECHERGVGSMADLKLDDIPETLKLDGELLAEVKPELLTVKCSAGRHGIRMLRDAMPPEIKILGVTVLTSFSDETWDRMHSAQTIRDAVLKYADEAAEGGADGLVLSGREIIFINRDQYPFSEIVLPAVRPLWSLVPGDDQDPERIVTPTRAIILGATRIVVGRPITGAKQNKENRPQSPREAIDWVLSEIHKALTSAEG